jgi:hypothetical protein
MELSTLWFTMVDKNTLKQMLDIEDEKVPLALVFLGKAAGDPVVMPRKPVEEVVRYIR